MDAHVKCEYCSKGDHYNVKDYDMIKYFQVVELNKNCHKIYHKYFWKHVIKNLGFFIRLCAKVILKLKKSKF